MNNLVSYPAVILPRRRAEILTRQRLLDKLYDLLERKLILVVAPAGYGKTSLLVDFARQNDISACWYTIDRLDHDLGRFLAHFVESISHVYPQFGSIAKAALESLNGPDDDIEPIVTAIVNELYQSVSENFVIVLDDYQLVSGNDRINAFIHRFVGRVGENCHLFIASRQQPSIPDLHLLLARGQAGAIGITEMAFTTTEIQSLARNRNYKLSDDQITALAKQSQGWITGILLTPSINLSGEGTFPLISNSNKTDLVAYWNIVLDDQPPDIQKFLCSSSPLEEFNANLCENILRDEYPQDTDWEALLETVLRDNLFVLPVGEDGKWLRYHSLFQEYLLSRLERQYPGLSERILRRLVVWYRECADWDRAYNISLRLSDVNLTVAVIEEAGPTLIKYGRFITLSNWLDKLPAPLCSSHPGLISLRGGIALMGGKVRLGLDLLNQSIELLRNTGDRYRLIQALVRRSTAHFFLSDYPAALSDAENALALIGEDTTLAALNAQALKARGVSLHRLDRSADGICDIEASLTICLSLNDTPNIASLYQELGIIHRFMGDLVAAESAYLKSMEYWQCDGSYYHMSDLLNNLGVLYHQMGDYEHALVTLEEGLEHARLVGYKRLEAFLLASLGDLFADLQANETAQQLFTLALDIARQIENRFVCFYVNYALANLARTNGKYSEAHRLIETAMEHLQPGSSLEQGLLTTGVGQLAVQEKKYGDANESFNAAIQHFRCGNLAAEEMKAHLCLAAAFFESDDQNAFLHHLQDAFRLAPGISSGYHPLLMASFCAIPVLERARRDPEIGETVAKLLDRLRRLQADLPHIRRNLRRRAKNIPMIDPKIVIQSLGATRIKINGKTVHESDWKSRLQRELFFYLLQHPDGTSKDKLLSLFWHGNDSQTNYLATTIYKIHRVFGENVVQFRDERYYFNRALDYEYDVESFVDQLNRAKQEGDHSRRISLLLELLPIYQGEFLPHADGSWVVADRERLFQAYIEAVGLLGESLTYQGEHRVGLDYFLQAIDRDPCREEFYRLAMKASSALGDRDRISYYYQLCQQALVRTHGVEPSSETRKLYLHLMQS